MLVGTIKNKELLVIGLGKFMSPKTKFFIPLIALILAGCESNKLEFKSESLTGQRYGTLTSKLIAVKNCEFAELSLKYSKEAAKEKSSLVATLVIDQSGKEYNINPHEQLTLYLDGKPYVLEILNSHQDTREETETYYVSPGPGKMIPFGRVKELTRRKISFLLSADYLSKIMAAKSVTLEISSFSQKTPVLQGYPIILEFTPENVAALQDFEKKCVNNFMDE